MPEGPEVKTIVNQLQAIKNYKIVKAEIVSGRFLKEKDQSLINFIKDCEEKEQFITEINCKGKFIYFKLSHNNLCSTLGMTGAWQFFDNKHTGFKLLLNNNESLYFNDIRHFGTIKYLTDKELNKKLSELGPDLLNDACTLEQFSKIINKNKTLPEILMNQKNFSGIGNYIKSEALFAAKISPHRTGSSLSQDEIAALKQSIENIMKTSLALQGASLMTYKDANGSTGTFDQFLKIYNKNKVDSFVVKSETTKDNRTTWWCPEIQK
jgi:formamidopyrimidine-DNA glycosylase